MIINALKTFVFVCQNRDYASFYINLQQYFGVTNAVQIHTT